jgi:hypothetical protein
MNTPEWLKPGLLGVGVGAVALAITGFTWGGWVTGPKAEIMAANLAKTEVLAALVPICLEQSRLDPQSIATLAVLKDTSRYQRNDILMEAGWATMPGSTDPNRNVARACMDQLATLF